MTAGAAQGVVNVSESTLEREREVETDHDEALHGRHDHQDHEDRYEGMTPAQHQDPRAGRWGDSDKTECGIHFADGAAVSASI